MNTQLQVALPDDAPKLTRGQVLKATADALDSKNIEEWKASKERRDVAWKKLRKKAEKIARSRLRAAEIEIREEWKQESYTVELKVKIPRADLAAEIDALNACPVAKRITFEDYLDQLRKAVAARDDAHIRAFVADPKINQRFVELGQTLIGGAAPGAAIEA